MAYFYGGADSQFGGKKGAHESDSDSGSESDASNASSVHGGGLWGGALKIKKSKKKTVTTSPRKVTKTTAKKKITTKTAAIKKTTGKKIKKKTSSTRKSVAKKSQAKRLSSSSTSSKRSSTSSTRSSTSSSKGSKDVRVFTVTAVTSPRACAFTGGKYKGITPTKAAKKAASKIFKSIDYSSKKIKFIIKVTGRGASSKTYEFIGESVGGTTKRTFHDKTSGKLVTIEVPKVSVKKA